MTAETATSSAASAALPHRLTDAHVRDGKLFANRYEMVDKLSLPQRPLVVAEVGVQAREQDRAIGMARFPGN